MKAREAHHKTGSTDAEKVDASDNLIVTLGEKQNGDVSKQDLRQALQESRDSEARLRKIIDTIAIHPEDLPKWLDQWRR